MTKLIKNFTELDLLTPNKNKIEFVFKENKPYSKEYIYAELFLFKDVENTRGNIWNYMFSVARKDKTKFSKIQGTTIFALNKKYKSDAIEDIKKKMIEKGFKDIVKKDIIINQLNLNSKIANKKEKDPKDILSVKDYNMYVEIKQNKRGNIDSLYARNVLVDLGLSWDKILFKDKGVKGYLIKINNVFNIHTKLIEAIKSNLETKRYPFSVKYKERNKSFVLEVEYFDINNYKNSIG